MAGNDGLDARNILEYLLILIKADHNRKTYGYQDLHADQSETDYRSDVLSKGNCGQSSCAAKHQPTDQNEVLEKSVRYCCSLSASHRHHRQLSSNVNV